MEEKSTCRPIQSSIMLVLCSIAMMTIFTIRNVTGENRIQCISGNCDDGEGACEYSDGSIYRGSFNRSMRHGAGSMFYPDGSVFIGRWENDQKKGEGISLFSDGSEFRGVFRNGYPEGEGIFISSDGVQKKVYFRDSKIISSAPMDFERIDGIIRFGTVLALGGVYTGWYSGFRATGYIPERRGRIRWEDGSTYSGQWQNGKMHGRGVMKWPDGSSYVGEWNSGRRSGFGTYTWKSGSKYMGSWKDNRKHGPGIAVYADGSIQQGIFFEDTYLGSHK